MARMSDLERAVNRFRRELLQNERRAAGEMVRYYGEVWRTVSVRLDALQRQIAEAREAGEEVSPAWLFRQRRLESLRVQVEAELRRFAEFADGMIRRQQEEAIRAAQDHAEQLVLMQLPDQVAAVVRWDRLPQEAIYSMVGTLQDGSPLRELLMELGAEVGQGGADALVTGLATGMNPQQTARLVRKRFGMGLARALRIARTETLRAYRYATHRSYRANSRILKGWVWHAELGPRTCPACIAMHGTFHRLDETLDDHPNGRCTPVPVTKGWRELGEEFGVDWGGIPETQVKVRPGVEWFAEQTEDVQRRILGSAAFEAWRAGTVRLEDFVGRRSDPRWGTMRYARSLRQIIGEGEAKRWRSAISS
ncbi:MAG: hypothetical protein GXP39_07975 [Chloroflexi bacterium]|nr:hypothetical protein [Chloroflexota bacterium]